MPMAELESVNVLTNTVITVTRNQAEAEGDKDDIDQVDVKIPVIFLPQRQRWIADLGHGGGSDRWWVGAWVSELVRGAYCVIRTA